MKKEYFFCVGLEGHSFQKALGCEVGPERGNQSEVREDYAGGKAERIGSLMASRNMSYSLSEAELLVGSKAGGV